MIGFIDRRTFHPTLNFISLLIIHQSDSGFRTMSSSRTPALALETFRPRLSFGDLIPKREREYRNALRYPDPSKRLTFLEHLSALWDSLRTVRTDNDLLRYAWLMTRDPRASSALRSFARKVLRAVRSHTQEKIAAARRQAKQIRRMYATIVRRLNAMVQLKRMSESDRLLRLRQLVQFVARERSDTLRAYPDWPEREFGKRAFFDRLDDELTVYVGMTYTRGIDTMPLPSNVKRMVLNRVLNGTPFKVHRSARSPITPPSRRSSPASGRSTPRRNA